MNKKLNRKTLKRLDTLQTSFWEIITLIRERKNLFMSALIPTAMLVGGLFAYNYYQNSESEELRDELFKIVINNKKVDSKKQALEKEIANLENKLGGLKKSPKLATLKTEISNKRASLTEVKLKLNKELDQYENFFNEHKDSLEGKQSGLIRARYFIDDGSIESLQKAKVILKSILSGPVSKSFYNDQVRRLYIAILEDEKDYKEALNEIDKLLMFIADKNKPEVLLMKVRILKCIGDEEGILNAIALLREKYSSSLEVKKALAIHLL